MFRAALLDGVAETMNGFDERALRYFQLHVRAEACSCQKAVDGASVIHGVAQLHASVSAIADVSATFDAVSLDDVSLGAMASAEASTERVFTNVRRVLRIADPAPP